MQAEKLFDVPPSSESVVFDQSQFITVQADRTVPHLADDSRVSRRDRRAVPLSVLTTMIALESATSLTPWCSVDWRWPLSRRSISVVVLENVYRRELGNYLSSGKEGGKGRSAGAVADDIP